MSTNITEKQEQLMTPTLKSSHNNFPEFRSTTTSLTPNNAKIIKQEFSHVTEEAMYVFVILSLRNCQKSDIFI